MSSGEGTLTYSSIANIPEQVQIKTFKDVLNYVSEEDIFAYYLGSCDTNVKYKSPFTQEKTPSFSLYYRYNKLRFKCFSSGNYGDCFNFVSIYFNLTYQQTIVKIVNDLLGGKKFIPLAPDKQLKPNKSEKNITVVTQPYTLVDVEYWSQFNIDIQTLEHFKVYSCREVWINGKRVCTYNNSSPVYAYHINGRYKVYRPMQNKLDFKFMSNTNDKCIQGFSQLTYTTDTIYITSSMKDVMTLHSIGVESIALSSETANLKPEMVKYLQSAYRNVVLFFNNDQAGISSAIKQSELFNLSYIHTPEGSPKDPSDYVKEYGITELEKWLQN